jgi:hypothetical protein
MKKTRSVLIASPEYRQFIVDLKVEEHAPEDNPSIGIILCAEKDDVEVEYALKTKQKPSV